MTNNHDARWKRAGEKVLEIIADDAKWELFVRQVKREVALDGYDLRKRAETSLEHRALLESYYVNCVAEQICDTCGYNSNRRRGEKKFSKRKVFDCSLQEEPMDRTKAPSWLDAENNICPNYYLDRYLERV